MPTGAAECQHTSLASADLADPTAAGAGAVGATM